MGLRSRLNLLTVILLAGSAAAAAGGASTKPSTADGIGEKPPPDAVVLFDGSNLDVWQPYHASREMKTVIDGDGVMTVAGGNIVTRQAFGDFRLHLEFRCPDMPPSVTGQKRGNSGVYFHDRYELQILGYQGAALPTDKECGAIYGLKRPDALATRPDDTWQAFDVVFRAPRFDATGRKTHDARATVHHNGVLIHNDVPIPKISGGGRGAEAPTGPIRLQDKGHKVAFRNIWVAPLKEDDRSASAVAVAAARGGDDLDITLSVVPGQMKFDINRFTVRPGSTVRVTLTNADSMPHNWLLCRGTPGETELEVARLAWAMPDALQRGYVPPSPLVLAATKMLEPRQSDTVTFRAPREPGDYPYVCTYPGHAMIMRGVMRVSTQDPVGAAPPAALQQLSYTYYEADAWKTLPDLEKLTPLADEYLPSNVISIKPRKRASDFGFMYDAELLIRDPGRYRFFVGGHGGYRLNVDDKVLVNFPGKSKVYQIRDGALELKPGVYAFRLEYYHRSAVPAAELALACKFEGTSSTVFSLSEDDVTDRVGRMMLQVHDEPLVVRASLPNASPRAIAVGLGGGINYCFDAQECFVRYGWEGDFLDASAERGNGTGRGGEVCNVENVFPVGPTDKQPLRIGSSAASSPQQAKFLGYRRNGKEPPSFLYRVGQTHVTQTIAATPDGRSLHFTYKLDPPPPPSEQVLFDGKPLASQPSGEYSVTIPREHHHAH